jgi:hypothetical protein
MKDGNNVKNKLFVSGFLALLAGIVALTGCVALSKTFTTDLGAYDASVPESQMAELLIPDSIQVTSFNGASVRWLGACKIKIPAGNHSLAVDFKTASAYAVEYGSFGTEIYTQKTISNQGSQGIALPSTAFEAGRSYDFHGGKTPDNRPIILVRDKTNLLLEAWGDTVIAPEISTVPTEFEGAWRSPDNILFTFKGNSWERTLPQQIWDNSTDKPKSEKGTFEYANGKITMYSKLLGPFLGSIAHIYDYSLDGKSMTLEVNGYLPKAVFEKQ